MRHTRQASESCRNKASRQPARLHTRAQPRRGDPCCCCCCCCRRRCCRRFEVWVHALIRCRGTGWHAHWWRRAASVSSKRASTGQLPYMPSPALGCIHPAYPWGCARRRAAAGWPPRAPLECPQSYPAHVQRPAAGDSHVAYLWRVGRASQQQQQQEEMMQAPPPHVCHTLAMAWDSADTTARGHRNPAEHGATLRHIVPYCAALCHNCRATRCTHLVVQAASLRLVVPAVRAAVLLWSSMLWQQAS